MGDTGNAPAAGLFLPLLSVTGRCLAGSRLLLPQVTAPVGGHYRLVAAGIERVPG